MGGKEPVLVLRMWKWDRDYVDSGGGDGTSVMIMKDG